MHGTLASDESSVHRSIRTIFVSDFHLGCPFTQSVALVGFLKSHSPEYLYLVGDIIDGWRLNRHWYWDNSNSELLNYIRTMIHAGTQVFYTPGNHDEFLRGPLSNLGKWHIRNEVIHTTVDNRRILVTHGDQFDVAHHRAPWLSRAGDLGYSVLLVVNQALNAIRRRIGLKYWSLSAAIKRKVKQTTSFLGGFEVNAVTYAKQSGCVGVVCGHIHSAKISTIDGIDYYNTGDWVESCTALVEFSDGQFRLLHISAPSALANGPATEDNSGPFRPDDTSTA